MGFVAGSPVAPVVGTVEILNGTVGVVDVVVQLVAAVGAVQQTGELRLRAGHGIQDFERAYTTALCKKATTKPQRYNDLCGCKNRPGYIVEIQFLLHGYERPTQKRGFF